MLKSISFKDKLSLGYALFIMIALLIVQNTNLNLNFYVAFLLALTAFFFCAFDVVLGAFKTLFKRHRMSEEFLMTIASAGAFS